MGLTSRLTLDGGQQLGADAFPAGRPAFSWLANCLGVCALIITESCPKKRIGVSRVSVISWPDAQRQSGTFASNPPVELTLNRRRIALIATSAATLFVLTPRVAASLDA